MTGQGRIVVILGPTAGGKSDLAVAVAQAMGGQIISADSMQIYRELNAGTAKPSAEQREAVRHHLIDVVDPTEPFTVANWVAEAQRIIRELHAAGRLPVVVGGTNLYLKALLEGMFDGPAADEAFRASLAGVDAAMLHQRLVAVDPQAADRIHPNDHKRLVRALEVHHLTGQTISDQQTQWSSGAEPTYRYDPVLVGLSWESEAINRRINARVKAMFHPPTGVEDLVEETRRLEQAGRLGAQARQAIGTKQVLEHLAGEYSAADAMEQVKIETRRFARTQRTWLKRYRGVHWLFAGETPAEVLAAQAVRTVSRELASG
jgi:tRNA dimethylallyltransferase